MTHPSDPPDGKLYLTQGEKSMTWGAQASGNTITCGLRLNLDGSIPAGQGTGFKLPQCWLWGIRNGAH